MARNTSVSMASLAIGMLAFSLSAVAQDVMLKVNTTVGEGRPQASEHKIAAGTETAIHTDSMYRVMVKPTVVSATNVQLSFKVVDVASGETVSAPSILARVGQQARVAQGTESPNPRNLRIDVTPSL